MNLAPLILNATELPCAIVEGLMEVTTGAAATIVKFAGELTPAGVVTYTGKVPATALLATLNTAVIRVVPRTVTLLKVS